MKRLKRQKIGNLLWILLGMLWIYMAVSKMFIGYINVAMATLGVLNIILNIWILLEDKK